MQGGWLDQLQDHPGILMCLSVSVYTKWPYHTPASVCLYSVTDHLGWHVDILVVSALLVDAFRQNGDDTPYLSCLTGSLYGWKRLN